MVDGLLGKNSDEMNYPKKILIVGFGSIGKRHVNNLLRSTNSNLIIFSKRQKIQNSDFFNFKQTKNRIKITTDFKKCLEENPDLAFITNETSLHVKYAIKLATRGIHIFIEKPLSNSLENLEKLMIIVREKKVIVMVGCNFRFYPPIQKIKEMVDKKIIGKIISLQIENSSYLPDWHPHENYKKGYAAKDELGGGVTLTQIHELDFISWIFGKIKKFHSFVGKFSMLDVTSDDLCAGILKLENNIIVELHLDYFSRPYYKRFKMRGTQGILYWSSEKNLLKIFNFKKQCWSTIKIENNYKLRKKLVNKMYVDEIKYFLKCLSDKKQPMNNLAEAIPILKSAIALKNS